LQRRVAEGETFASAAAAVGCSTKSVQRLIARRGGLRDRVTAQSPLRLSLADREELSRGLVAGASLRQIAARVGRSASTLTREVERNGRTRDLSGMAGRDCGRTAGSSPEAREVGLPYAPAA